MPALDHKIKQKSNISDSCLTTEPSYIKSPKKINPKYSKFLLEMHDRSNNLKREGSYNQISNGIQTEMPDFDNILIGSNSKWDLLQQPGTNFVRVENSRFFTENSKNETFDNTDNKNNQFESKEELSSRIDENINKKFNEKFVCQDMSFSVKKRNQSSAIRQNNIKTDRVLTELSSDMYSEDQSCNNHISDRIQNVKFTSEIYPKVDSLTIGRDSALRIKKCNDSQFDLSSPNSSIIGYLKSCDYHK